MVAVVGCHESTARPTQEIFRKACNATAEVVDLVTPHPAKVVATVIWESQKNHVIIEGGLDGIQAHCSCSNLAINWCVDDAILALRIRAECGDVADDWVPEVGGMYGIVSEARHDEEVQYSWTLGKVVRSDPHIAVQWYQPMAKDRFVAQCVKTTEPSTSRKKAKNIPWVEEVDANNVLRHQVKLKASGKINNNDLRIVLRLWEVWWNNNVESHTGARHTS